VSPLLLRSSKDLARPAIALAVLALLAVLIRAPFNSNSGVNEAYYLVVGRQWLHGLPPYVGAFDVKPPLLFLLMTASEALFGPVLLAAKALATTAAALAACGLYLFGRRFMGEIAGVSAAVLYIVSTLSLGGTFSPAELIMAPFTVFGMLSGALALFGPAQVRIGCLLLSGLLFGAAVCVKQTALFEAAALALALMLSRPAAERVKKSAPPLLSWPGLSRPSSAFIEIYHVFLDGRLNCGHDYCKAGLKAACALAVGLCIVPLGFALYFLAIGRLDALVNDAVIAAFRRAGSDYAPAAGGFRPLVAGLFPVLPIITMAGLLWAGRRKLRNLPCYPAIRLLALWAAGALAGVFSTKSMFVVYCLPLLQPLCLAAGGYLQHLLAGIPSPNHRGLVRTGVLGGAVLYSCWAISPLFLAGGSNVKAAEAAALLIARERKSPEDRVLVLDRDVLVYLTAGIEPPLSMFHPVQLLCVFPRQGARTALVSAMNESPAFIVAAGTPGGLNCENRSLRKAIEGKLAQDYCPLGHFGSSVTGWPGSFTLFGLKARGCSQSLSKQTKTPPAV